MTTKNKGNPMNSQSTTESSGEKIKQEGNYIQDYIYIAILIIAGIVLYILGIGDYGLWDPWEPKYAQALREMRARGDYFTPYFAGSIRWTKPILIYWLMFITTSIFSNNEFATRLPSGIIGIVGLLVMYYVLRHLYKRSTAMIGACILGTLPQYVFIARRVTPDIHLTVFLGAAMGFLGLALFEQKRSLLHYTLFYASTGLAFLSKGPLAGAIVVGSICLFWVFNACRQEIYNPTYIFKEFLDMFKRYRVFYGILVFSIVTAPWYLTMLIKHGKLFIDKFFVSHNIHRFTETVTSHWGTVDFYFRTFFHGMFPWSSLLPVAFLFYFAYQQNNTELLKKRWFYFSWFLSIFFILEISATKFQYYLAPIMFPMVMILIFFVDNFLKKEIPYWTQPAFLLTIPFAFLPIKDFLYQNRGKKEGLQYIFYNFTVKRQIYGSDAYLSNIQDFLWYVFIGWCIAILTCLILRKYKVIITLAIMVSFSYSFYFTHHVIPGQEDYKTLKSYVTFYMKTRKPGDKLIIYGKRKFSVNYYSNNQYKYFGKNDVDELVQYVLMNPRVYLISIRSRTRKIVRKLIKVTKKRWYRISKTHVKFDLLTSFKINTKKYSPD